MKQFQGRVICPRTSDDKTNESHEVVKTHENFKMGTR